MKFAVVGLILIWNLTTSSGKYITGTVVLDRGAANRVQGKVPSDVDCSRSIVNSVHNSTTIGTDLSVIALKLPNVSRRLPFGLVEYFSVVCNGSKWGVWIFKCGYFKSKDDIGWENEAYISPCSHRFDGRKGVHFESSECSDAKWREVDKCGQP